jgi:ABC-type dipeptide/oligopeptide/nickel transport system permease component
LVERAVLLKHQLPNALMPVVTILGPLTATLVTGSFVVEYIFAIPGMGRFFITAVTNRDYPLIMGVTLLYAALLVIANVFVDLAYAWLDPRVKPQ